MLASHGPRAGTDVALAFSPERVDPGNPPFSIRNTPKVVGGVAPRSTRRRRALYERVVANEVVPVSLDARRPRW